MQPLPGSAPGQGLQQAQVTHAEAEGCTSGSAAFTRRGDCRTWISAGQTATSKEEDTNTSRPGGG